MAKVASLHKVPGSRLSVIINHSSWKLMQSVLKYNELARFESHADLQTLDDIESPARHTATARA